MRPSEISEAVLAAYSIGATSFITGPSGIGKSDVCNGLIALGQSRGIWSDKARLWDYRAIYREPVDMLGLPHIEDGITKYAKPAGLPWQPDAEGVLFLDEYNSATPQNQGPGYQLFLEHRVADHVISPKILIVGAGNRMSDRGLVHRMPDPLANRMFHFTMEPDLNDWCNWALATGVDPVVVAFIRFRPALLHDHNPKRECAAFATPRAWVDVSKVLGLTLSDNILFPMIRGRVGDGATSEFLAFLGLYRNMVSPDAIMANPTTADVPTNPAILYALAEALARRSTAANFAVVLTYAKRMPKEYSACLVSSATRITPALCNTREFIQWASEQG